MCVYLCDAKHNVSSKGNDIKSIWPCYFLLIFCPDLLPVSYLSHHIFSPRSVCRMFKSDIISFNTQNNLTDKSDIGVRTFRMILSHIVRVGLHCQCAGRYLLKASLQNANLLVFLGGRAYICMEITSHLELSNFSVSIYAINTELSEECTTKWRQILTITNENENKSVQYTQYLVSMPWTCSSSLLRMKKVLYSFRMPDVCP